MTFPNSWYGSPPLSAVSSEIAGAFGPSHTYTINAGVVAGDPEYKNLLLAGEAGAADDLDNITGYDDGDMIVIAPSDGAVTITVKDSANLNLQGADFTMNDIYDSMILLNVGSDTWKELSRSAN